MGRVFTPIGLDPRLMLFELLYNAIGVMMVIVVVSICLSWVAAAGNPQILYNPFLRKLNRWSAFITAPMRKLIKPVRAGMVFLDISSLLTLIALNLAQGAVIRLGYALAGM